MTIKATPIVARNLKPGDLFSTLGAEYWDHIDVSGSCGEKLYVRTNAPTHDSQHPEDIVYLIEVQR
jgi:hypothetical protein